MVTPAGEPWARLIQLSERAKSAIQVWLLRQLDTQRNAVVIELSHVRAARAKQATKQTERLKQY